MITAVAGLTVAAFTAALYSLGTADGERFTRRACVRLLILGASGLSLLPARLARGRLSGHAIAAPLAPDEGLVGRWAHVGRIWREMSSHLKGQLGDPQRAAEFDQLKVEMTEALDSLPAWPELRVVFEERWAHVHRERYVMATCYSMAPGGPLPARIAVERQVEELAELVAEGKLSAEAAGKAAETLAVQAEYLVRLRKARDEPDSERWEVWRQLWEQYQAREIGAGPGAQLAGKRLAELTVEELGLLAGPPQENEGMPLDGKEPDNPQEDAEQ